MPLPEGSNIVVSFLEPQEEGSTFERTHDGEGWPQHVTMLPWYTLPPELHEEAALPVLEEVANTHAPFWVTVGGVELFGPNHNVPVSVISPPGECKELHLNLMQALGAKGLTFVNEAHTGENYHPHITHNSDTPPRQGDIRKLWSISLVRLIGERTCRVMRHFPFRPSR